MQGRTRGHTWPRTVAPIAARTSPKCDRARSGYVSGTTGRPEFESANGSDRPVRVSDRPDTGNGCGPCKPKAGTRGPTTGATGGLGHRKDRATRPFGRVVDEPVRIPTADHRGASMDGPPPARRTEPPRTPQRPRRSSSSSRSPSLNCGGMNRSVLRAYKTGPGGPPTAPSERRGPEPRKCRSSRSRPLSACHAAWLRPIPDRPSPGRGDTSTGRRAEDGTGNRAGPATVCP